MSTSRIITHRCMGAFSHDSPFAENSLGALRWALTHGADGVECDIHLTRDGHLVVHHDPILSRTTLHPDASARALQNKPIGQLDLAQIRLLKLRHGQGEGVPTLDEVFDAVEEVAGGEEVELMVEIKTRRTAGSFSEIATRMTDPQGDTGPSALPDDEAIVRALIATIAERDEARWWRTCVFLSFDFDALMALKRLAPQARAVLLEPWEVERAAIGATMAGFEGLGISTFAALQAHAALARAGLRVVCGGLGVNEPMVLSKLVAIPHLTLVVDDLEGALRARSAHRANS